MTCSICNRTVNQPTNPGMAITIDYIPQENSITFRINRVCDDVFCRNCLRTSSTRTANRLINCPCCDKIFKDLSPCDIRTQFVYKKSLFGISKDDLEVLLIEIISNRNIEIALTIIETTKCYETVKKVINFLISIDRQEDAEKITALLHNQEDKSLQLINISCSYLENNQLNQALRLLQESATDANLIKDPECRSELLINLYQFHLNIFYAYFKTDQIQNALSLLQKLQRLVEQLSDQENKCVLQLEIAKAYLKSNQIEDTFRLLQEAEKTVNLINDPKKRAVQLKNISDGYLKIKKFTDALRLLQEAEIAAILTEDSEYKYDLLIELCNRYLDFFDACLRNNKLERAFKFLQKAERIVNQIPDQNIKSNQLKRISDKYLKIKKTEDVFRLLQNALICASLITEPFSKAWNLMNISDAYLKADKAVKALITLQEAEKTAMKEPILESKIYLLREIEIMKAQCVQKKYLMELSNLLEHEVPLYF